MSKFAIFCLLFVIALFVPPNSADIRQRDGNIPSNQLAASYLRHVAKFTLTPLEKIQEAYRRKSSPISQKIATKAEDSMLCIREKLYGVTNYILYDRTNFDEINKIPEVHLNFPSLNARLIQDTIDLLIDITEAGQRERFDKIAGDAVDCLETLLEDLRGLTIAYRRISPYYLHNFHFL